MALTEGDKAICRDLAREIIQEVLKDVIVAHIDACPHGHIIVKGKWLLIGLSLASGFGGGISFYTLVKLLTGQ